MTEKYTWAKNPLKLQRAIAASSANAKEAEVKAKYVEFGGSLDEVELKAVKQEQHVEQEENVIPETIEVAAEVETSATPEAETPVEEEIATDSEVVSDETPSEVSGEGLPVTDEGVI